MPELAGQRIALRTHDAHATFAFVPRFYVQQYFTFSFEAASSHFSGASHFCTSSSAIRAFVCALRAMASTLAGSATLTDADSDAFVTMVVDKLGHVGVCGRVGGTHESHSMVFEFSTDQTCIEPFASELEHLLQLIENQPAV